MNQNRHTYFALALSLLLLILPLGCTLAPKSMSDLKSYESICDELFQNELTEDAISLHFALANPEKLHIYPKEDLFPSYLKQDQKQKNMYMENALNTLQKLDTTNWDACALLHYDIITSSLKASLDGDKFLYFSEPFSATHGIQNEYPLLLSEYAFRNENDIRQYLKILEKTPDYFHSLLAFEQERMEAGYPLSTENADGAIAACDSFARAEELFIRSFENRITPLTEKGILSANTADYYKKQNERLVSTVLLPAFRALGDGILVLSEENITQQGLCLLRGGSEYYRYLLHENVGTDKDINELKLLLNHDLKENLTSLHNLAVSTDAGLLSQVNDPLLSLSPDEMTEDLRQRMSDDFPFTNPEDYPYEVSATDTCLEPYTAPAYYFTPPMDLLTDNHIYINESQTSKGIHLYTTLAHEGFPGHLYQAVTTQKAFDEAQIPYLRSLVSYGGYVEGYATYAELLSYQYAKECALQLIDASSSKEGGNDGKSSVKNMSRDTASITGTLYDLYYYDRRIKLCLYCLLDIKIHAEGLGPKQIASYLADFGIRDASAADQIYRYILNEPTTYLKYYVGFLEFDECRQLAVKTWGTHYSDSRFHSLILKIGPAPFSFLRKAILSYGDSFLSCPSALKKAPRFFSVLARIFCSSSSNPATAASIISL